MLSDDYEGEPLDEDDFDEDDFDEDEDLLDAAWDDLLANRSPGRILADK